MDINRTNMDALFKSIVKGFQDGMTQKPPVDLSFLFSPFPSATAANFYPWLEQIPGFKEWLGDRVFQNLRSQGYTVPNRDFELSLSMPAKDLDDDQYGMYVGLVQIVAANWPTLLYELIIEVLTNRGPKCWDNLALFATTHKYGDNTVSNLVSSALTKTTFEAALLASAEWKFANGKLCRTQFTHLLHGRKLAGVVFDLIENKYVNDGTAATSVQIDNRNFKKVIPVEIPDFAGTYDDYWVLLDCSGALKPVIRQIRKTPVVTMTTDPERIAEQGKVNIMADGRAAAAPGLFHMAYGGIL
jgi:phage major head subunit gpT-like protein